MYKPVWDFLGSLVGCSLKKVQAFLNGVVMVFFQEAIWFDWHKAKPLNMLYTLSLQMNVFSRAFI